jgi:transposase
MNSNARLNSKEREMRRVRAIEAIKKGYTQGQVASLIGASRTSVANWVGRFKHEGTEGLLAQSPGRPLGRQLYTPGAESCRLGLLNRTPEQLQIPGFLWTSRTAQVLLSRELNSEVSRWTVSRYLAGWGLNAPRPLDSFLSRTPDGVRKWFTHEYPKLKERARRANASILFLELTVVQGPAAITEPVRNASSTTLQWIVGGRGDWAFMAFPHGLGPDEVISFCDRSLRERNAPLVIVTPGDAVYSARPVRDWVARRKDQIALIAVSDADGNLVWA